MSYLWKKVALPFGILAAGVVVFFLLMWTREPPQQEERIYLGPLVETVAVSRQDMAVVVEGQGTVQPSAQVDLVPQVAGVVAWMSPQLETGAFFDSAAVLLRIDPADYQLAVEQADARVAQMQFRLDVAVQEADAARKEWDQMGFKESASPLVLRMPQLAAARAEFDAARAILSEARLHLARTELRAPFSGRVQSASVDAGQFVTPGRPVARLYDVGRAEIAVAVPSEDLAWLPDVAGKDTIRAMVAGDYAGRRLTWSGYVARTGAELDPMSRMAQVIVVVDNPYAEVDAPLMPGLFVDVAISGKTVSDVRVVPREAVRPGGRVWAVGGDGRMRMRSMAVLRSQKHSVVGKLELAPDERLVTSHLSEVTDGMKVRTVEGRQP